MASLDVPKNPWKLWIFSPRQYSCTPWCLIFFFFDLGSRRKTCRWKVRLSAMIWSYWNHECDVQWMYDVSLSVAELFVCGGDISNSNFINFVTRWQDSWFNSQFTILSQFYDGINGICGLKTPRKDRSFLFFFREDWCAKQESVLPSSHPLGIDTGSDTESQGHFLGERSSVATLAVDLVDALRLTGSGRPVP